MDFFKAQIARLQQQFAQLTASQKMLSVALVAIMVMTLGWWGRYAGQAEFEQVLDQDFAAEDMARVTADLRGRGIPYTTQGSRVLVPADRKFEVLGDLVYQQLLPKDMSSAFNDIYIKNENVLAPGDRSERLHTEARQTTLAQIIRNFPKVRNAVVMIDNNRKRTFDQPISASASVFIKLKQGDKADNRLCNAAADVVCGAVAGLKRKDVRVVVDGVSRPIANDAGDEVGFGGAGTWMDTVRESESYYASKIFDQLSFCDGVMVHVNCLPKDEYSETKETKYDAKGAISKELENESETSNTSGGGGRGSGDVGVNPNTGSNKGMSIADAGGGGGGETSTQDRSKIKSENFVPKTETMRKNPAGSIAVTSASVTLPRSFFIKAYKAEKRVDKDPSDAVLGPYITDQLDRCKNIVRACINLQTDGLVVVDTYTDLLLNNDAPAQATSGVSLILGTHGKEIALGGLALVSLFMVSMMVRKSGPAAVTSMGSASFNGIGDGGPTTVDAVLAKAGIKPGQSKEELGEVGEGGQALDGVELDDDTVRSQQVLEQVSTMVKENPDAAANLVKRWLSRA